MLHGMQTQVLFAVLKCSSTLPATSTFMKVKCLLVKKQGIRSGPPLIRPRRSSCPLISCFSLSLTPGASGSAVQEHTHTQAHQYFQKTCSCIFIYLLHALRRKFSRRCLRLARKLAHSEVGLLGCLCGGKRSLCNIH